MTRFSRSAALRNPETIHPSLWRGSQLAPACRSTVPTGYAALDSQLPGQGWPGGTLIEILLPQPGIGEIQLVKPALQTLQDDRNIILLNPPYTPSSLCMQQWLPATQHIFWIRSDHNLNTLWAAEKILQHNTSAALLCWFDSAPAALLHRLHLSARQSGTLFFCLRPASFAKQNSAASLRLTLEPSPRGLNIHLLKRQGPLSATHIQVELYPCKTVQPLPSHRHHDALDQHPSVPAIQHCAHTERRGNRPAAIHS